MTGAALIEPVPAPEIFCSGLGRIENIGGGCLRFYLYVLQAPVETEGPPERVLVAKIISPLSAVPDAVAQLLAAMGGDIAHNVAGRNCH